MVDIVADLLKRIKELEAARKELCIENETLKAELLEVSKELVIADTLLAERNKLLAAIPECATHGQCVSNAIEWVEKSKIAMAELDAARKQADKLNALIAECTVDGELDSRLFNAYMEYASPVQAQQTAKLYAWQPQGHGEYSFFVVAHSEEEARKAVGAAVIGEPKQYCNGWGTDYHKLSIADIGEVILNDNA